MPIRRLGTEWLKSPGEFIRDRLLEGGEDYVESIYRSYRDYLRPWMLEAKQRKRWGRICSYHKFQSYMSAFTRLGYLEFAREEVAEARGNIVFEEVAGRLEAFRGDTGERLPFQPRRYYRLTARGSAELFPKL